jgi:CRP/FNR family transcriptional regulator, cyclic AMP receptor protein
MTLARMSASAQYISTPESRDIKWRKVPVLAGLSPEALYFLASKAIEVNVAPGELIVREGDHGNKFFVISDGSVRVVKHFGTSDEVELARLREGEFFGEMCILETLPRTATVQAVEPALLWSLSSMAFYNLYKSMPQEYSILVLNLARDLSRRLRKLDEAFTARH